MNYNSSHVFFLPSVLLDKQSQKRKIMPENPNIEIEERDRILAEQFAELVVGEKLYLDRHLNLEVVSKRLETNRGYLSGAINRRLGKSFSRYINELRVEESIKIMRQTGGRTPPTLEQIARMSGFNDRRTLFCAFKQARGQSPGEAKEKIINRNKET